jgi:hypothetical protein
MSLLKEIETAAELLHGDLSRFSSVMSGDFVDTLALRALTHDARMLLALVKQYRQTNKPDEGN